MVKVFLDIRIIFISRLGLYRSGEVKDLPGYIKKNLDKEGFSVEKCSSLIPKGEEKVFLRPEDIDTKVVETKWMCINQHLPVDLSSTEYGGQIIECTDEHYSPAHLILSSDKPTGMEDGLESSRSRGNHNEEVVVGLRNKAFIKNFEFDFTYFINNSPREIDIYGDVEGQWVPIVKKMMVKPWAGNTLRLNCDSIQTDKVRLRIFPDGGINRFKVFGVPAREKSLSDTSKLM